MLRVAVVLSVLLGILTSVVPQAQAQSEPGHVYQLLHWKADPGSEADYSQAYWDVVRPVWDQSIRQGGIVSYLDLSKQAGDTGDATRLILVEFED